MDQEEISIKEEQEKEEQYPSKTTFKFVQKHHPKNQIIGDVDVGIQTRRRMTNSPWKVNFALLSKIEPKDFAKSSKDEHLTNGMEEELNQIEKNGT